MKTLIGGSMGQYFKYKIDKVKFNNIKEHNFFEVYGWCYAQNVELISYEVKVNNKDRKSTRLNSSHANESRMPSSA